MVTSYDERGRVEAFLRYTENLGYDAVYYTYNSANQVLSVRVCDPLRQYATWYGYDANGRMNKMWTSLGANGTGLGTGTPSYPTPLTKPHQEDMQYTYDQMGRVEQMRYLPEDVLTHYRYNERSWLDSMFAIDASSPSDTVFKQRLSRDARGHITGQRSLQMGQTARVESYVYDGLDQLVEWSRGGSTVTYSYDIVGNRTSDNEPGTSRSYTFGDITRPNKLTAMTAGTKTTSYSYDANGAMTEKLLTDGMMTLLHQKLTYTQGGLVRQFEEILSTPGSITCVAAGTTLDASKRDWRYRYSATGEREQKRLYYSPHGDACGESHAWTYYLLGAGDEQLAVYNGRQTNEADECENTGRRVHIYAVEYLSPGGVASVVTRPDGTKELNLRDHLGSVRTVVKAGLTLAQYDYKPFGKVDWSAGGTKREGYIGKEEDRESLLGDYGVRKYDADIGRFLSADKLFQSQPGYSPYHYSANDPVNGSDPSGLFQMTAFGGTRITDVSMGDFEQGFDPGYGSFGGSIMVPIEFSSNPDPLTPGTRMRSIASGMNTFAASSGGGLFYHGSTPSLMNSAFLTGGSNNPVTHWPNSVQPEIVIWAERIPITLGIITDAEIDRIASAYAAEGSFPWNLSEVLDKSPQYALWDFKRKTDLLPYKSYWYNGAERQRDEIGNVIWGRVMASSGWPLSISLGAAGAYQTVTGASSWEFWQSNWQNFGDDSRDSRGIKLGYSNGSYAKIMTIRALQGTLNIMLGSSKSMNDFQSIHRLTTLLIFR